GSRFPRALLTDSAAARALHEERQVGLALAAKQREVDLRAADAAAVCVDERLRPEALSGEDAPHVGERRVEPDAFEVATQLVDGIDRSDALDLDGDPPGVGIAAHEIDRPDVRRPLAPDEPQL